MMKILMILLTIVGGSGPVAASGSDGSEETISRKAEQVEVAKSPADSKAQLHFCPENGTIGGPMPFCWKGKYHLFFLGLKGRWHVVSENLVNWKELPIALPVGAPGEPDSRQCATGSIIERNGTFHFFYTGRRKKEGKAIPTICRSTSEDLIHWKKDPGNPIMAADHKNYIGLTKHSACIGRSDLTAICWKPERQK